jgi:hypothetical protein
MKKFCFLFLLTAITFSVFAQAPEQEYERKFSIQIDPLMYIGDIVLLLATRNNDDVYNFLGGFEFQYALTKYWNISIEPRFGIYKSSGIDRGFGYGSYLNLDDFSREDIITHLTFNPGVLFRPFGSTLKSLYVGLYPTIGWKNVSVGDTVNDNYFVWGITGGAGYQWVFKNGFTIALGGAIGTTAGIPDNNNTGKYDKFFKPGLDLILNTKLGYSF